MKEYSKSLKVKSDFLKAVRNFLSENHGFIEINTPKISFMPTDQDEHLFKMNYFGKKAYLIQSPQFYKQAYVINGLSSVFEVAPVFRAESRITKDHLSEFTSLDIESSEFKTLGDIIDFEKRLIQSATNEISQNYDIEPIVTFEIITYKEAKKLLGLERDEPIRRNHEAKIADLFSTDGVFIRDYPEDQRVFYYFSENGISESFDLIVKGLEVTSGGIRTNSYKELIRKMKKEGINHLLYKPYLDLFKGDVPIHGGFAIGIERIIAKYLNIPDIIEVNPFSKKPNTLGECLLWK
ncbi:MAG: hypothetical protein KJ939_02085 [Nanoarchaeota archaeon]|nr:hypothetical protein [Nanoarchaeota archaeon]MBU4351848.1 hypothetical protein [Nanoarchaeota archaeon]